MRQNIRDKVFTLSFSFHQFLDTHNILGFFKRDLVNDKLLKCSLISITSLQSKSIQLVINFSRVIQLKYFLGAADDLIKLKSCGTDFGYDFSLRRLNDLLSVF